MAFSWPAFGATGSYISMSVGALGPITQGAYTMLFLVLPSNTRGCGVGLQVSSSYDRELIWDGGALYGANDFTSGFTPTGGMDTTGTKWQWTAQRKAAGTQVYEFAYRNYTSGGTIQFATGSGTHADLAGAVSFVRIGQGDVEGRGGIAVGAMWKRRLSDAELTTAMGSTASAIMGLSPDALWLCNVASVSALVDSTGNGANYSSVSGSSNITVISDPAGYDFSLTSTLTLAPGSARSTEQFGTGLIVPNLTPGGIQGSERFGTSLIVPNLTPGPVGSGERFGTSLIVPGTTSPTPGTASSVERFGSSVLQPGVASVASSSVQSAERWGTSTLIAGGAPDQAIAPGSIVSTESFGASIISPGAVSIAPGSIRPTEQFGTSNVGGAAAVVAPGSIVPQELFGSSAIVPLTATIAPGSITPQERFGYGALAPDQFLVPGSIVSPERWGSATLGSNPPQSTFPGSIRSDERWGTSLIEYGAKETTHKIRIDPAKFEADLSAAAYKIRLKRMAVDVALE